MLDEFGIVHLAERRAGELSFGQRKLLEFAAVLMGRPQLVLLDEPTVGRQPGHGRGHGAPHPPRCTRRA